MRGEEEVETLMINYSEKSLKNLKNLVSGYGLMHVKGIPFDSESSVYAPPHVDHEIPEDEQTL